MKYASRFGFCSGSPLASIHAMRTLLYDSGRCWKYSHASLFSLMALSMSFGILSFDALCSCGNASSPAVVICPFLISFLTLSLLSSDQFDFGLLGENL